MQAWFILYLLGSKTDPSIIPWLPFIGVGLMILVVCAALYDFANRK
jgi:hypothetical protein